MLLRLFWIPVWQDLYEGGCYHEVTETETPRPGKSDIEGRNSSLGMWLCRPINSNDVGENNFLRCFTRQDAPLNNLFASLPLHHRCPRVQTVILSFWFLALSCSKAVSFWSYADTECV